MRKQTKVVAVASAAALLAIGASMTSFAATGWQEEDGVWYYYDSDGNRVEDDWKKSGNNWYWLDSEENGAMATDKLVEDDGDIYYVDANGVMVTNVWVKVVNEDQDDDDLAEYHYYYMQSNGKAYKAPDSDNVRFRTIDGKRYAFDDEGKMLYGWVDINGDMKNEEGEWSEATYYLGSWEDGAMKTGWQKVTVYDEEKEDDYDYWFSFKSNGKKRTANTEKNETVGEATINGKKYGFDERGVMTYQWTMTTGSNEFASTSSWRYFNSPEDGAKAVKGWFRVVAPDEDNDNTFKDYEGSFATKHAEDKSEKWYYADSDGELAVGEIKKINGKYYGFHPEGEKGGAMLAGLCALIVDEKDGSVIDTVLYEDMDSDDLDEFMDKVDDNQIGANTYLYYFSDNEEADGSMKTGMVTVDLDGDSYQFQFRKSGGADSRGRSVHGVDGDYIYKYGQRMKADSDQKYVLVRADGDINDDGITVKKYDGSDVRKLNEITQGISNSDDGKTKVYYGFGTRDAGWYLVNTSGKIQDGKKSGVKDGDDYYWYINKNDDIIMYTDSKDLADGEDDDGNKTANLKDNWDAATTTSANLGKFLDKADVDKEDTAE